MNVTVAKSDLLKVLSNAMWAVPSKTTMPILSCVRLSANTSLEAYATDLSFSVTSSTNADVKQVGQIAVNAKDLKDRAAMMPEGPLILVCDGDKLTIKAKGTARKYTLRTMSGLDFPKSTSPSSSAEEIKLSGKALSECLQSVKSAVSSDIARPHMNGSYVDYDGARLRTVATDGHRLSLCDSANSGSGNMSIIFPERLVKQLSAGDFGENVTVLVDKGAVWVKTEDKCVSFRAIDGEFPPYQQVIPKSFVFSVRMSRTSLIETVKAMSVAADKTSGGVKLKFGDSLVVTGASNEAGESYDELECEYVKPQTDKKGLTFGVNWRYLVQALEAVSSEKIELSFGGEWDPVQVKGASDASSDSSNASLSIIMPMRV